MQGKKCIYSTLFRDFSIFFRPTLAYPPYYYHSAMHTPPNFLREKTCNFPSTLSLIGGGADAPPKKRENSLKRKKLPWFSQKISFFLFPLDKTTQCCRQYIHPSWKKEQQLFSHSFSSLGLSRLLNFSSAYSILTEKENKCFYRVFVSFHPPALIGKGNV